MQLYETIFIVKQYLDSAAIKAVEEKYENLLKLKKATIEYSENWGLRNLAYKIQNFKKGYYYMLVFNSDIEALSELERNFRIDENIIRFLTTKIANVPTEPSFIMKAKIEKENSENMLNEEKLISNEGQQ